MQHISTTPFGRRPVTAGLLAAQALASGGEAPCPATDKWQILRDLGLARARFGVSDRDLAVLSALISFHPGREIGAAGAVVFPSNATLSARAHGMAESTLRRHLAALVAAGLILRQDSPNGKRYAVRGMGRTLDRAFGFDLSPLAHRAAEISALARAAEQAAAELRCLRETIVLQLRDCDKLLAYAATQVPGNHDALADEIVLTKRQLRRKPELAALRALSTQAAGLLKRINQLIPLEIPAKSGGNGVENERHIQDSTITLIESESCDESGEPMADAPPLPGDPPLALVLRACPEIRSYASGDIRNWKDLVATAGFVRAMMGITPDAWSEAQRRLGPSTAAITLACILQSFDRIGNPGGYLRALARKGEAGAFSPGPMVRALLQAETARAA